MYRNYNSSCSKNVVVILLRMTTTFYKKMYNVVMATMAISDFARPFLFFSDAVFAFIVEVSIDRQ